jgi:hypothetical protein
MFNTLLMSLSLSIYNSGFPDSDGETMTKNKKPCVRCQRARLAMTIVILITMSAVLFLSQLNS